MRHAVLLLALAALAGPLSATGERAAPVKAGSVLAVEWTRAGDVLVRVDANSLRPVSKRVPLGGHAYAWSFSPDRRWLAIGFTQKSGVRIFDVRRMKPIGRIQTWSGAISTLAWVSPRRLLGYEPAGLFLLDPAARKRLPSPQSSGSVLIAQRAGNRLVLLTAPALEAGPTRLAVVDGDGVVRSVQLDRIQATGAMDDQVREFYRPALVLDPAGRAYVVGARPGDPTAAVDLDTLRVVYHEPRRERSLVTRFRNWLEPAAEAKEPVGGSFRTGAWLGDGKLAVWGSDSVTTTQGRIQTTPAGVSVIDTKDWTTRMIDPDAWHAAFAGGTLLATEFGSELRGYATDGSRRYQVSFKGNVSEVATFQSRALVTLARSRITVVVDAVSGRVLGGRRKLLRPLYPSFFGSLSRDPWRGLGRRESDAPKSDRPRRGGARCACCRIRRPGSNRSDSGDCARGRRWGANGFPRPHRFPVVQAAVEAPPARRVRL